MTKQVLNCMVPSFSPAPKT